MKSRMDASRFSGRGHCTRGERFCRICAMASTGCKSAKGGSVITISITVMPSDHVSAVTS